MDAVVGSIAKCGAARAVSIAQLLFPSRSKKACAMLVAKKWQPVLASTITGGPGTAARAIASTADLERALAVCGDPGALDTLVYEDEKAMAGAWTEPH